MPNIRWLLAAITRIHRFVLLRSGGRLGSRAGRLRFLLLHHVGRRSGRPRATPLLYLEDEGRWLVVASNAGDDRHPAWWLNLRERPEAEIQVAGERVPVKARAAAGPERQTLWRRLVDHYPDYAEYETRTDREIPVVVLERR